MKLPITDYCLFNIASMFVFCGALIVQFLWHCILQMIYLGGRYLYDCCVFVSWQRYLLWLGRLELVTETWHRWL